MAIVINMPQVGQDIETALITEWHVNVGDTVVKGDIIATVDSDKASFEVEVFDSGTVLKLLYKEGEEGDVFKPIAYIGDPGENISTPVDEIMTEESEKSLKPNVKEITDAHLKSDKQFVSPSARRIALKNSLNVTDIVGSGPLGRVIKSDILSHISEAEDLKTTPLARKMAESEGINLTGIDGTGPGGRISKNDVQGIVNRKSTVLAVNAGEEVIYFSKARKRIAERLTYSKQTIPHYYLFIDVDVTNALHYKSGLFDESGIKVSFNDILIKIISGALRQFDYMNAFVDEEKVILKPMVNIGIAVSVENGLLVPVLTDADKLDLIEIVTNTRKLVDDARRGVVNNVHSGTFTISNLGMFGISRFHAIINPPECAIMSIGKIEKRVVPSDQGIKVTDMVTLGLAVDHRAVDGAMASRFLEYVKKELEEFSI